MAVIERPGLVLDIRCYHDSGGDSGCDEGPSLAGLVTQPSAERHTYCERYAVGLVVDPCDLAK